MAATLAAGTGWCGQLAAKPDPQHLTLAACFESARTNNAKICMAFQAVRETEGEAIAVRSRWLPQLYGHVKAGWQGDTDTSGDLVTGRDGAVDLELRQRLAEFGPTTDAEYARLTNRRQKLYGYENQILETLSEIRRTYFSLRIAQQQRVQHDSLLAFYQEKLLQSQTRLASGVGVKNAVLTAQLNVLEERERILGLRKRERVLADQLGQLTGAGRFSQLPRLVDGQGSFAAGEDSCVSLAMRNDTHIADAQDEARLARRRLREKGWEFGPVVAVSAAVSRDKSSAGLQLSSHQPGARHAWALDAVGTQNLVAADSGATGVYIDNAQLLPPLDPDLRYTAGIAIEFPIFRGLKGLGDVRQAAARYEQARTEVLQRTQDKERTVREAFIEYQASKEQLAIQEERVGIARQRYELAEIERDLGRLNEDGFDSFRSGLFYAQDSFYQQQFQSLEAEERLRKEVRLME